MCISAKLSKPCAVLSSHDLIPGTEPGIKSFCLIMRNALKKSRHVMTCCLGLGYSIAQPSKQVSPAHTQYMGQLLLVDVVMMKCESVTGLLLSRIVYLGW